MFFADTSAKKNLRRAQLHSRLPAREWEFRVLSFIITRKGEPNPAPWLATEAGINLCFYQERDAPCAK